MIRKRAHRGLARRGVFGIFEPNRCFGCLCRPLTAVITGSKVSYEGAENFKIYWQTVAPADPTKIEHVMVIHHGFGDTAGWYPTQSHVLHHVGLHNAAVRTT